MSLLLTDESIDGPTDTHSGGLKTGSLIALRTSTRIHWSLATLESTARTTTTNQQQRATVEQHDNSSNSRQSLATRHSRARFLLDLMDPYTIIPNPLSQLPPPVTFLDSTTDSTAERNMADGITLKRCRHQ
jgi:hypothetical protein